MDSQCLWPPLHIWGLKKTPSWVKHPEVALDFLLPSYLLPLILPREAMETRIPLPQGRL
jgi:hypothetical protein